jgi:hypothetical protein
MRGVLRMPTVKADELVDTMQWVSGTLPGDNQAYICRQTGKIYLVPEDFDMLEEEEQSLPDDLHDESKYLAVPGKYDLDLGNHLVYDFTDRFLPARYDHVRDLFRRKGAYGRFKEFLQGEGLLEKWYDYSNRKEIEALIEWGESNGLEVEPPARQKPTEP